MRFRWMVLGAFAAVVLAATAWGQKAAPKPNGDLARLQGTWAAVKTLPNGSKLEAWIEFRGDLVYGRSGDDPKPTSVYRAVLGEAANPKTLDLVEGKTINAAPGSLLEKFTPPDMFGIYRLEGDRLTVASRPFDPKRPTEFRDAEGIMVMSYTRGLVAREEATAPAPTAASAPAAKKGAATAKAKPAAKVEGDLAALQGTWTSKAGAFHGNGAETMTIKGDRLNVVASGPGGESSAFRSQIQLDEASHPKGIDFRNVTVGKRRMGNAVGIYELDGDTLTLHKSGRDRPRSATFQDGSESGRTSTWTRQTAEQAKEAAAAGKKSGVPRRSGLMRSPRRK